MMRPPRGQLEKQVETLSFSIILLSALLIFSGMFVAGSASELGDMVAEKLGMMLVVVGSGIMIMAIFVHILLII
jgi:hypothetical protein